MGCFLGSVINAALFEGAMLEYCLVTVAETEAEGGVGERLG